MDPRLQNVLVPTSVLLGGVGGLLVANALWPTPSEFREHGWEPGLFMLAGMFAVGAAVLAIARTRR
jgi:hypothetical protein